MGPIFQDDDAKLVNGCAGCLAVIGFIVVALLLAFVLFCIALDQGWLGSLK